MAPPPPPPPVAPGPPPEPDRRFGAGMLLALVVLLLAAGGAALAYFLTHRDSSRDVTTVVVRSSAPSTTAGGATRDLPDVTGKRLAVARTSLEQLGFRVKTTAVASRKPAGTVVDQAPDAGSPLAKGEVVVLGVAQRAHTASTSTAPATTTSPAATTTAPAATTATTTAPTPPPPPAPTTATVPDVTGGTEVQAAQALAKAGILASIAFVPSSDPLGSVEGQAKQAGTTVPYHSHMQINVSRGPGDKPQEHVPDVVGRTLEQAVAAVNGANLRLIYVKLPVTSRNAAGKIVQQSPLGGGSAPRNAQVLVFLGAYRR